MKGFLLLTMLLNVKMFRAQTCTNFVQKGLDIDGIEATHNTGRGVSISNAAIVVAVGAHLDDDAGDGAGHVRVYEWTGSTWTQKGSDIDGEAAGDNSGQAVRISGDGDTVVIGAPNNDGDDIRNGHMRVFEWTGSTWAQKGSDIDGPDTNHLEGGYDDNNYFSDIGIYINDAGSYVAFKDTMNHKFKVLGWVMSGWTVRYESSEREGGAMAKNGDIAVYTTNSNDAWEFTVRVMGLGAGTGQYAQRGSDFVHTCTGFFSTVNKGLRISLSGDGLTVAYSCEDENVNIRKWNGGSWVQAGSSLVAEFTSFSSDGNRAAFSYNQVVTVRDWDGTSWNTVQTFSKEATHGFSVGEYIDSFELTASGHALVLGDHGNDEAYSDSGHVRVFESCPTTTCTGFTDPGGTSDRYGEVAMGSECIAYKQTSRGGVCTLYGPRMYDGPDNPGTIAGGADGDEVHACALACLLRKEPEGYQWQFEGASGTGTPRSLPNADLRGFAISHGTQDAPGRCYCEMSPVEGQDACTNTYVGSYHSYTFECPQNYYLDDGGGAGPADATCQICPAGTTPESFTEAYPREQCEDIDECDPNPCPNNGVCSDSTTDATIPLDSYKCADPHISVGSGIDRSQCETCDDHSQCGSDFFCAKPSLKDYTFSHFDHCQGVDTEEDTNTQYVMPITDTVDDCADQCRDFSWIDKTGAVQVSEGFFYHTGGISHANSNKLCYCESLLPDPNPECGTLGSDTDWERYSFDGKWTADYVHAYLYECNSAPNNADDQIAITMTDGGGLPLGGIDYCADQCRGLVWANGGHKTAKGFIYQEAFNSGPGCYCEAVHLHPHEECSGTSGGLGTNSNWNRYDFIPEYAFMHYGECRGDTVSGSLNNGENQDLIAGAHSVDTCAAACKGHTWNNNGLKVGIGFVYLETTGGCYCESMYSHPHVDCGKSTNDPAWARYDYVNYSPVFELKHTWFGTCQLDQVCTEFTGDFHENTAGNGNVGLLLANDQNPMILVTDNEPTLLFGAQGSGLWGFKLVETDFNGNMLNTAYFDTRQLGAEYGHPNPGSIWTAMTLADVTLEMWLNERILYIPVPNPLGPQTCTGNYYCMQDFQNPGSWNQANTGLVYTTETGPNTGPATQCARVCQGAVVGGYGAKGFEVNGLECICKIYPAVAGATCAALEGCKSYDFEIAAGGVYETFGYCNPTTSHEIFSGGQSGAEEEWVENCRAGCVASSAKASHFTFDPSTGQCFCMQEDGGGHTEHPCESGTKVIAPSSGWQVYTIWDGGVTDVPGCNNAGLDARGLGVCVLECTASSDPSKDGSDGEFYCINGGEVFDILGSCGCACPSGFAGDHCEIEPCDGIPNGIESNGVCLEYVQSNKTGVCDTPSSLLGPRMYNGQGSGQDNPGAGVTADEIEYCARACAKRNTPKGGFWEYELSNNDPLTGTLRSLPYKDLRGFGVSTTTTAHTDKGRCYCEMANIDDCPDADRGGVYSIFKFKCPLNYYLDDGGNETSYDARCRPCPVGLVTMSTDAVPLEECLPPFCYASSDEADDGTDGNLYCINGGTASGVPGQCICTGCNSEFGGPHCAETACLQNEYLVSGVCTPCASGYRVAGDVQSFYETSTQGQCSSSSYVTDNVNGYSPQQCYNYCKGLGSQYNNFLLGGELNANGPAANSRCYCGTEDPLTCTRLSDFWHVWDMTPRDTECAGEIMDKLYAYTGDATCRGALEDVFTAQDTIEGCAQACFGKVAAELTDRNDNNFEGSFPNGQQGFWFDDAGSAGQHCKCQGGTVFGGYGLGSTADIFGIYTASSTTDFNQESGNFDYLNGPWPPDWASTWKHAQKRCGNRGVGTFEDIEYRRSSSAGSDVDYHQGFTPIGALSDRGITAGKTYQSYCPGGYFHASSTQCQKCAAGKVRADSWPSDNANMWLTTGVLNVFQNDKATMCPDLGAFTDRNLWVAGGGPPTCKAPHTGYPRDFCSGQSGSTPTGCVSGVSSGASGGEEANGDAGYCRGECDHGTFPWKDGGSNGGGCGGTMVCFQSEDDVGVAGERRNTNLMSIPGCADIVLMTPPAGYTTTTGNAYNHYQADFCMDPDFPDYEQNFHATEDLCTECPSGYYANTEQTDCLPHGCTLTTCLNAGTCADINTDATIPLGEFVCTCATGYDGEICQNQLCGTGGHEACRNGGTCFEEGVVLAKYGEDRCWCPSGEEGHRCERDASNTPCGVGEVYTGSYYKAMSVGGACNKNNVPGYSGPNDYEYHTGQIRVYDGGDLPDWATSVDLKLLATFRACIDFDNNQISGIANAYNDPTNWVGRDWWTFQTFLTSPSTGRTYCYDVAPESDGVCPTGYTFLGSGGSYNAYTIHHNCVASVDTCQNDFCEIDTVNSPSMCLDGLNTPDCDDCNPCPDSHPFLGGPFPQYNPTTQYWCYVDLDNHGAGICNMANSGVPPPVLNGVAQTWGANQPDCVVNTTLPSSVPCLNGGTCSDGQGVFTCACAAGFAGDRCETPLNCVASSNPAHDGQLNTSFYCDNNGTIGGIVGSCNCTCVHQFSGTNCNECAPGLGYNFSKGYHECETCPDGKVNDQTSHRAACANHACDYGYGYTSDIATPDFSYAWDAANNSLNSGNCRRCPPNTESPYGDGQCVLCTTAGMEGLDCLVDTDECSPNNGSGTCLNGATCFDSNNYSFVPLTEHICNCTAGWKGDSCEIDIDECQETTETFSQLCNTTGSVSCNTDGGPNTRNCTCKPGYEGLLCEMDINECQSTNNTNFPQLCNATGTDTCDTLAGINTRNCNCKPGYEGLLCNIDVDECASTNNSNFPALCDVTGTDTCDTLGGINTRNCNCKPGYEGLLCEMDIDECTSTNNTNFPSLCNVTGTDFCNTTFGPNTRNCTCLPGYEGDLCETDTNECYPDPCVNGACTQTTDGLTAAINSFHCACDFGWIGTDCGTLEKKLELLAPEANIVSWVMVVQGVAVLAFLALGVRQLTPVEQLGRFVSGKPPPKSCCEKFFECLCTKREASSVNRTVRYTFATNNKPKQNV